MAEAPLDGLYGPRVLLDADGTVELRGGPAGPAGVSVVELADGTVWSVDHADPTRLVGIEPPAGPAGPPWDLADSPLVIAAVGGDQALLLADLADDARAAMTHGDRADPVADLDDDLDDELDDELADAALDDRPRSPRRIRPNNRMGPEAGRIVVLADLSTDPDLDPLARIAAAIEFIDALDPTEGGVVLEPLVPRFLQTAGVDAADVDDDDLDMLDPKSAARLGAALRVVMSHRIDTPIELHLLAERLGRVGFDDVRIAHMSVDAMAAPAPSAAPSGLRDDHPGGGACSGPVPEDFQAVTRLTPSLLRVTAARTAIGRWALVHRRDGLVLLAQAPFVADGLVAVADLAVPPDTAEDELDVHIVAADDLTGFDSVSAAELVRAAVRTGREAARLTRLGVSREASRRWEDCAVLWETAGDDRRARAARRYGERGGFAGPSFGPFLADELSAGTAMGNG